MSERRVVFHLHCYQPPRESPWTGRIPLEVGAAPFHDWNDRITDECYRPLRAARVLDGDGHVVEARNLYRDVSFDVGPTLHRWLALAADDVDRALSDADRVAADAHAGHGAAIAQPYVHAILPLATPRDRDTLVRWGIDDFRRRFGRAPEGMWLPETAVDVATLECLAAQRIRFTILGPQQAARVHTPGGAWEPATGALDSSLPHRARLPSGQTITICFYDGHLSSGVAFETGLLDDGPHLAEVVAHRARGGDGARLVLVASDGETYGHHHRFGEMALARALRDLAGTPEVVIGGLAAFVAETQATHEVEIVAPSSWSCTHGVERWRHDCGDVTAGEPHWDQRWRAPLREALDALAARVHSLYEHSGGELVTDPWDARDGYGDVIDAPVAARVAFVREHARDPDLGHEAVARVLGLLEMQRHLLLAFSSCAWFFADCAGLETRLSLAHAARAVELARACTGVDVGSEVARVLASMQSNDPSAGNGRRLWRDAQRGAVTPSVVAAWWAALATIGVPMGGVGQLRVEPHGVHVIGNSDSGVLVTATLRLEDERTLATETLDVASLARDARLAIGVGAPGAFAELHTDVDEGGGQCPDAATTDRVISAARARRFALRDLPLEARVTVIDAWWRRARDAAHAPSVRATRSLIGAARASNVTADAEIVEAVLGRLAPTVIAHAARAPVSGMSDLAFVVGELGASMPDGLRWEAQNAILTARDHTMPGMIERAVHDDRARRWLQDLERTAERLAVWIPSP